MIDYCKADSFFQCIIHELLYNASMAIYTCLFKLNIHKIILYLLFIDFLDKTL